MVIKWQNGKHSYGVNFHISMEKCYIHTYSHYKMMVNPIFFAVKVLPHQDMSLFIDSGLLPAGCTGHSNGSWHSRPLPGARGKTWSENGGFHEKKKQDPFYFNTLWIHGHCLRRYKEASKL